MEILILNKEQARELSPLSDLLADTGKPITTLCGIKIFTTEQDLGTDAFLVENYA